VPTPSHGVHAQVTLIDQSDRFVFKPLLYDLVAGVVQPWEVHAAPHAPYHLCITKNSAKLPASSQ